MTISPLDTAGSKLSMDTTETDRPQSAGRSMEAISDGELMNRPASPAKRSASAMNGHEQSQRTRDGSAGQDALMQDAASNDDQPDAGDDLETLDERVDKVLALQGTSISADEAGYLVSYDWLSKVFSKSTRMRSLQDWDEATISASIGRIDNSGIVPSNAFVAPHLKFADTDADFIPLRPELERGADFEVLPKGAWDLIVQWYGVVDDQLPIIRYAKDTAPPNSAQKNIMYEYYPPVFTVRKMLSQRGRSVKPPSPPPTSSPSATTTRQATPEQEQALAVQLVASRQDRFNTFLARSKRAAGIPLEHKVRTWKQLDADQTGNASALSSILTPAASRSNSPSEAVTPTTPSLIMARADFVKMQDVAALERLAAEDNTANPNYNGKSTLDLIGLTQDAVLILEEQTRGPAGGEYASDARASKSKPVDDRVTPTVPITAGPVTRGRTRRDGRPRGTIGLTNLGNTCYMNSALQCISRIEELAWYFLENRYKQEINTDNPLGYNGRMAKAYADFLHSLYQPGAGSAYTPRGFKSALSQAQPMFSGYGQQDSQEFLSFLVDALHEDLNRIHKKPYLENPDSDDSKVHDPEYIKELGNVYRDNFRKRNDSIAMDLFNGFYKNTMVCPNCDKVSVTFDPYSLLTLQLPVENTWQHTVFFVPEHGRPAAHTIDLDKNASIRTFKQHLANKVGGIDPSTLFVVETFQERLYKVFKDGETVGEITSSDVILVFELSGAPTNISKVQKPQYYRSMISPRDDNIPDMDSPMADRMAVTVNFRTRKRMHGGWSLEYQPMIIMITREEAKDYDEVLRKIFAGIAKYTSRDFLNEDPAKLLEPQEAPPAYDSDAESGSESVVQVDGKLSDDEYVEVSMADGDAVPADDRSVTLEPMSISPALRSLFEVRFFSSPTGDFHCASNTTHLDTYPMVDRVQPQVSRRSSLASIASVESRSTNASASTANSQASSNTEADDESNNEARSLGEDVVSDEDEIMEPSPIVDTRPNRRKNMNGRNRRKQITYGRKNRLPKQQSKREPRSSFVRSTPKDSSEHDPYFIKLGEGICLDWTDEGWDALFGGDPRTPEDPRGYMTLNSNFTPVVKDEALEQKLARRARRKKEGVSLDDCFAETAKTETLSEENAWYCNRCKELRRADKTLEIWTAPDVLVLHLKRFSGERYRRDKVDVLVDFPLEGLDLSERIGCKDDGKEYIYDLFAVDNHYGGLGGGHYTAYAKNFFSGKWYDFNDSFVSEQGSKSIVAPSAYLLFYRRRSSKPLGPEYLQTLVESARNPSESSEDEDTTEVQGVKLSDSAAPPPPVRSGLALPGPPKEEIWSFAGLESKESGGEWSDEGVVTSTETEQEEE